MNVMARGYDRPLYILPFDHRGSFLDKTFGWKSTLSGAQTAEIAGAKQVIYEGFISALGAGVPKEKAGILVDDQFGAAMLRDAASANVVTACPAEKSGQDEFDFDYGEDFARHIEVFDPTFCKVLVHYNPQGDRALNERQAARLKRLSDFLAARNRSRFMFELLVPAERLQLDELKGDKKLYDLELRPRLMVVAIRELQDAGVDPGGRACWRPRQSQLHYSRPRRGRSESARMAGNRCGCAGFRRLRSRSYRFLGSAGCLAEQKSDARAGSRADRRALPRVRDLFERANFRSSPGFSGRVRPEHRSTMEG
jgi:hypothetical protein